MSTTKSTQKVQRSVKDILVSHEERLQKLSNGIASVSKNIPNLIKNNEDSVLQKKNNDKSANI